MGNHGGQRPGAGRPAETLNRSTMAHKSQLSELTRNHTEAAVSVLVDVMLHGTSDSARISAASSILDRGYGRPVANLDVNDATGVCVRCSATEAMSDEELEKRLAELGVKLPSLMA
jgi:hypothetical protein